MLIDALKWFMAQGRCGFNLAEYVIREPVAVVAFFTLGTEDGPYGIYLKIIIVDPVKGEKELYTTILPYWRIECSINCPDVRLFNIIGNVDVFSIMFDCKTGLYSWCLHPVLVINRMDLSGLS